MWIKLPVIESGVGNLIRRMRVVNDFHLPDALSHSCEWASAAANLREMAK